MSRQDKNILNPETLMIEADTSSRHSVYKGLGVLGAGAALFALCLWLYAGVFKLDMPKTAMLRRQLVTWESKVERLGKRLDTYEQVMSLLEVRDNRIYRPLFGMNEIPYSERADTLTSIPSDMDPSGILAQTMARSERLLRRAALQGHSYDDVERFVRTSGDMASHIPAIPPVNPDPKTFRFSSPFGYRRDPINGGSRLHKGIDFGFAVGNPIYATGDGKVSLVKEEAVSYGHQVVIDHGFGYQSRYAHMSQIFVFEGQTIKRGDCVGLSGNTGRSTGPHLHYEVLYRGEAVDPLHYMDLSLPPKDYFGMVRKPSVKR